MSAPTTKKPKAPKLYSRFRIALADTDSVRLHEFEERIVFPCFASFKKDGVRAAISPVHPDKIADAITHTPAGWVTSERDTAGHPITRSLKYIPNRHVQLLMSILPHGLDGEIGVVVDGKLNFRQSTSAVMTHEGEPDIRYYVFDHFLAPGGKAARLDAIKALAHLLPDWVVILEHRLLNNADEARAMYKDALDNDDEGLIFAAIDGPYKPNRSTVLEGYYVKAKDKEDFEGVIVGVEIEHANTNEKQIDERGLTKRSSHKAGKVAKAMVGKLLVRTPRWPNQIIKVASGLTKEEKEAFYLKPPIGQIAKMEAATAGGYEAPRHAVLLGIRHPYDMGEEAVADLALLALLGADEVAA